MGGGFTIQVWQAVAALGTAIVAFFLGFLAFPKMRKLLFKLRKWFLLLAIILFAVVILFVLPRYFEGLGILLAGRLPTPFQPPYYWYWILFFSLLSGASALSLRSQTRDHAPPESLVADASSPGTSASVDLDSACEEIRLRLDQADINPSQLNLHLLVAPSEEAAEDLIRAAGLQIFAQAPDRSAPIHAYATSDSLFLSCSGATVFGTQRTSTLSQFEDLCLRILKLQPDCPIVRGVVLALPITWASRPESVKEAAAFRDDLQALERILKTHCPVVVVITGMETVPGFTEFMDRIARQVSPGMLEKRIGFQIPSPETFSPDLAQRGLAWMSSWFHTWILNLMAGDVLNHHGNDLLATLDHELRRYRKRLRGILEAALSTPRDSEPVRLRGLYFVASGHDRHQQAFATGLLKGPTSRILADHVFTDWAAEARTEDRYYFRIALAVGLIGALLSLWTWLFVIRPLNPTLCFFGILAILIGWGFTAWRITR